jgi:hypothetical protein
MVTVDSLAVSDVGGQRVKNGRHRQQQIHQHIHLQQSLQASTDVLHAFNDVFIFKSLRQERQKNK